MESDKTGDVGRLFRKAGRWLFLMLGIGIVGLRIGDLTDSILAGIGFSVAILVAVVVSNAWYRHRSNARLLHPGWRAPASVSGMLQISSLPIPWMDSVYETQPALAGYSGAVSVEMKAEKLWLQVRSLVGVLVAGATAAVILRLSRIPKGVH